MQVRKKEAPKVSDRLVIEGGLSSSAKRGGFQSIDGRPLDPEVMARDFGVTVEYARELIRRYSL